MSHLAEIRRQAYALKRKGHVPAIVYVTAEDYDALRQELCERYLVSPSKYASIDQVEGLAVQIKAYGEIHVCEAAP